MMEFFTRKSKGFTLIELLVVIAIIGILASIVLVSVNSARNKAKDSAIKSNIESTRVAAELWYDGGGGMSYANACAQADFVRINGAITAAGGSAYSCQNNANGYCAKANLATSGLWCADSTGYSGNAGANCANATSVVCQ